jgi:GSH-dependent disulfide-bond oxidoreductase
MIELHTWGTPNGRKISIMLEECGLPYSVHKVDISKGEQYKSEFLKISPNNRIPAIIDLEGPGGRPISLFESGAILIYLAEKTGKFLPQDGPARYDVLQWLMWQMGGVGPMSGQAAYFRNYTKEKIEHAINRYTNEVNRLYGVLDTRLKDSEFMAGAYSTADMATYPWVIVHANLGQTLDDFPHIKRCFGTIQARPAVVRGYAVMEETRKNRTPIDDKTG